MRRLRRAQQIDAEGAEELPRARKTSPGRGARAGARLLSIHTPQGRTLESASRLASLVARRPVVVLRVLVLAVSASSASIGSAGRRNAGVSHAHRAPRTHAPVC